MSEIQTGYSTMPSEWIDKYTKSLDKHIEAVREAGIKLSVRLYLLGIHDDSKWSREEFPFYARQFCGDAGDLIGFKKAWLHHIHQNPHHWQHWIIPDTQEVLEMPEEYALEMVADWMGSSFAYTDSWDMTAWLEKNTKKILLHQKSADLVNEILKKEGYEYHMFKLEAEGYERSRKGKNE